MVVLLVSKRNSFLQTPKCKHSVANEVGRGATTLPLGGAPARKGLGNAHHQGLLGAGRAPSRLKRGAGHNVIHD